jgi:hypothetical protein
MPEQLDLTNPIAPPPITHYRVVLLELNWELPRIVIGLQGPNREESRHTYVDATALALMRALNKANLSTTSLQKRVIQQLVADGKLAGTISGSPD